jgi:glucose uptake protein GlcU
LRGETLSDLTGVVWIAVAGALFGSQFIPAKYCPDFKSAAYNISMALGILVGSVLSLLALGFSGITPLLSAIAFAGGMTWVLGNYLLVQAVSKAGMARSFIVINFTAVFSFIGGVAFLGELPDVTAPKLALMAGAIGLVLLGSFLVTATRPRKGAPGDRHRCGEPVTMGLIAAFVATIFFSTYNVMIAYIINSSGASAGPTFISIAPGAVLGAVMVAFFARGHDLREWRTAPVKWHLLALSQGLVWATAMVCIMFGWMNTGIAQGTPIQGGTQTMVSSLWGILMFGEFRGLQNRGGAYAKFGAGAALTVAGIAIMAFI